MMPITPDVEITSLRLADPARDRAQMQANGALTTRKEGIPQWEQTLAAQDTDCCISASPLTGNETCQNWIREGRDMENTTVSEQVPNVFVRMEAQTQELSLPLQELSAHQQDGRHADQEDRQEQAREAQRMKVVETRVYRGPNPYGYRPVVRFVLDLGTLEQYPTTRLPGFTQRLLELVPTLQEHGCSYGEPGGFIRRLEEGTWLGHVAEHVAMELQCLAGTPVTYGKTRELKEQPGTYNVVYSYLEERVGLLAGWMALRLIDSLLPADLRGIAGLEMFVPSDARLVERPTRRLISKRNWKP